MFIGVDAGTSVVKAVGFGFEGKIASKSEYSVPTRSSAPGYAEQNLDEVLDAVGRAVRDVFSDYHRTVELLSITAQGGGLWLMDCHGLPIRPTVIWSDGRAADVVEQWMTDGTSDEAVRLNGNMPFSGSAAALIRHFELHEQVSLKRATT